LIKPGLQFFIIMVAQLINNILFHIPIYYHN
jgi:hypothetical protein